MEQEGLIRIQAVSDIEAFGITSYAYVGIAGGGRQGRGVGVAARRLGHAVGGDHADGGRVRPVDAGRDADARASSSTYCSTSCRARRAIRRTETFEACATLKHSYTWARILCFDGRGLE